MPNPNYPLHFEAVIAHLEQQREAIIAELRAPEAHEAALELKRQLDNAVACLEFCAPPNSSELSNYRFAANAHAHAVE